MRVAEFFLDFLYPPHCPKCGAYVEQRGDWCEACLVRTARPERLPIAPEMAGALASVWTVGRYHGGLQDLIRGLKYHGKKGNLPYIRRLLASCPGVLDRFPGLSLAVPVPLHEEKEKERGFNQAELIFRQWLGEHGVRLERVLRRNRRTAAQYGLDPAARRQNLKGAFSLAEGADVEGRSILLVDDIMTTGATLFACAEALKGAGAAEIHGLVLASDRA